jgi:cytochrome c-type biogenesis protein CcmH/NrfG
VVLKAQKDTVMQRSPYYLVLILLILVLANATDAVMSGSDYPQTGPSDPDYRAGLAALEGADWQRVIAQMEKVVAQRPWHDDAYNLMGFAHRKLGNYARSVAAYQQALKLNPHHRGALAYLGETYLAMGCVKQANEILGQLEVVCQRVAEDRGQGQWQVTCEEWVALQGAIGAVPQPAARACTLTP